MARTRLTHEAPEAPSSCFVCEPGNERGLQLEVFLDEEHEMVTTELRLGPVFSRAPHAVHGGVTLAVLDEIQSWAVLALADAEAVVVRTRVEFRGTVDVDRTFTAEAEVVAVNAETVETVGRIMDPDGDVRVEAVSTYHVDEAAAG